MVLLLQVVLLRRGPCLLVLAVVLVQLQLVMLVTLAWSCFSTWAMLLQRNR